MTFASSFPTRPFAPKGLRICRAKSLSPKAFLAELAERRGEISAEVISAQSLSDDQTRAVEQALQQVEGRNVTLSKKVDPALIGGMVVKVGSRMIDSSLKTQLERMKLVMKGAG